MTTNDGVYGETDRSTMKIIKIMLASVCILGFSILHVGGAVMVAGKLKPAEETSWSAQGATFDPI